MKKFIINNNDAGQRLDKFINKACKGIPRSMLYKAVRTKKIKLNGGRVSPEHKLTEGDIIEIYLNDDFFGVQRGNGFLNIKPDVDVVYEDEHILLASKKSGMLTHADNCENYNTLINHIKAYLYQKDEYNPKKEQSFAPALCNRIDRNTQGIVICAKTAASLKILNEKIKSRELEKYYLCICAGNFKAKSGTLINYILKDTAKNEVRVCAAEASGSKMAVTGYKVLESRGGLAIVEAQIITGRTHQIRAQLAYGGHPLLGDGKYGDYELNKKYGHLLNSRGQALCAYKLKFTFKTSAGILDYLNGKEFEINAGLKITI